MDHEEVELSNLQRYVLAGQSHVDLQKLEMAYCALASTALEFSVFSVESDAYLNNRNDWMFERVAVALDNTPNCIAVQARLYAATFRSCDGSEEQQIEMIARGC
ncbi:ThiF family adenylyltransferase [Bradyrhizobium septentrionale]|uniref:ThiF family adenylyltransferase n=1 Tax=Bradyrhizobium septentrionale TaxID=1404411 RepID=A0A973W5U8_9BRAD|nr:ThiF family adenylyltransferase [Bradyrhizobium septentrionale]